MSARFNLIDGFHPCRIKNHKLEIETCEGRISFDVRTDYEFDWDSKLYEAKKVMAIMVNNDVTAVVFKNGAINIFRNSDRILVDYEVIDTTSIKELKFTYTQIGAYNYGGNTDRLYIETNSQSIVIASDYNTYTRHKVFRPLIPLPLSELNYNTAYAYALDTLKKNPKDNGIYVALGTQLLGGDLFEDISSSIQEIQECNSSFYSL